MSPNNPARRDFLLAAGLTVPALAFPALRARAAEADAQQLLELSDRVRFPRESFETEITVTNFSGDRQTDEFRYRVMSRGNENTIVLTTWPASERGQAMLMRGRDLWVFMPSVSQPVRLSLSQRLTGQVANGDLARANFSGDYLPTLAGEETIDGRLAHVLELAARDRSVTYASVRYWVAADNQHPLRAEFHALSGKLLKTCTYGDFRELAGGIRPTRLVMEDALKAGERSVLTYHSMELRELPDHMFTREYLKRL